MHPGINNLRQNDIHMITQEFIFNLPLYTKVTLSENPQILEDLCSYSTSIDGYNPEKGAESTYRLAERIDSKYLYISATKTIRFECQRYHDNIYVLIHYDRKNDYIEKVGQNPSVADMHIAQVKQYKKVLSDIYIKDFTKAIGLAANGIGTGSFVYLRRVFEHLIQEVANGAIEKGDVNKMEFETSKMDNKLKLLSAYLPEVIIENKSLYSVLSAGIHTLSEDDCLKYFSVVREVIELILDEREYERQREEKKKNAKSKLGAIAGEVKKTIKHNSGVD